MGQIRKSIKKEQFIARVYHFKFAYIFILLRFTSQYTFKKTHITVTSFVTV